MLILLGTHFIERPFKFTTRHSKIQKNAAELMRDPNKFHFVASVPVTRLVALCYGGTWYGSLNPGISRNCRACFESHPSDSLVQDVYLSSGCLLRSAFPYSVPTVLWSQLRYARLHTLLTMFKRLWFTVGFTQTATPKASNHEYNDPSFISFPSAGIGWILESCHCCYRQKHHLKSFDPLYLYYIGMFTRVVIMIRTQINAD